MDLERLAGGLEPEVAIQDFLVLQQQAVQQGSCAGCVGMLEGHVILQQVVKGELTRDIGVLP